MRKGATKAKPDYCKPCPRPEQTPGDSEGQGGLACCSPRSHKELDTTEQMNINNNSITSSWIWFSQVLLQEYMCYLRDEEVTSLAKCKHSLVPGWMD